MGTDQSQMMFEEVNGKLVPAYRLDLQSLSSEIEVENHTEADAKMNVHNERPFGDTEDKYEQIGLEDIDLLPPALRVPRLPQPIISQAESASKSEATPFVTALDVLESRMNNARFNPLRPSRMYEVSVADSGDELEDKRRTSVISSSNRRKTACSECRRKKQRCLHAKHTSQSVSSDQRRPSLPHSSKDSKGGLKSDSRIKKDGTPYAKIPCDRSKGLSMTPSAIDYRERKVVQAQYQARLADLLDPDIVSQVEDEGGITPLGRLFKAGVRMMERVIEERSDRVKDKSKHEDDAVSPKSKLVVDESELLRRRATHAEEKLAAFKQAMRKIMLD